MSIRDIYFKNKFFHFTDIRIFMWIDFFKFDKN